MPHFKRAGRFRLIFVGTLAVIGIVLVPIAKHFLASQKVADRAAERLSAALGMPVQIGRVDVGWSTVSLQEVRLFEPEAAGNASPFAVIDHARIDLSAWDLLHGKTMPKHLTIEGATVTFVVDKDGRPVTRLQKPPQPAPPGPPVPEPAPTPGPEPAPAQPTLPDIDIANASLIIRQEGHADTTLSGISAHVHQGEHLEVTGSVDDPFWGNWDVRGQVDSGAQNGTVSLKTVQPVRLGPELLKRVPFADPDVIKEVQVNGLLAAHVDGRFDLAAPSLQYTASFTPQHADVYLPTLDFHIAQVHGQLDVENGLLHLDRLRGQTAGGEVEARGDLNFFFTGADVAVTVEGRNLQMEGLPSKWQLPKEAGGKLTGQAQLRSTFREGHSQIRGEGRGTINEARLLGAEVDPVPLTLLADDTGFHFRLEIAKALLGGKDTGK